MTRSLPNPEEFAEILTLVKDEAEAYLAGIDERPALSRRADDAAGSFVAPFPETGSFSARRPRWRSRDRRSRR